MQIESVPPHRHLPPLVKLALELGPLVLFFLGNAYSEKFGVAPDQKLFVATGVFIAATVVALAIHYVMVRRLPIMPLVSGVVVVVFGGLTLALQDKTFIMVKPTIVNALFGTVLLGGLVFGRSLLSVVLDSMFSLTEEGWRKLTFRWGRVLLRAGRAQRAGLADPDGGFLGQLQGVRHHADHRAVRPRADAAAHPLRAQEGAA
ncbi:intracellular septation protein [Methylobacterium radiotolerans]